MTDLPVINKVAASEGIRWVGQSFSIFSKSSSIWVVMLIIYFGISILLTTIPVLVLLPSLLAPIFNAGFMFAAKTVDNGQMLEIDHLFAGFKQQFRSLFRLGLIYFLLNLLIIAVISFVLEWIADPAALAAMNQATTTAELEKILVQSPELLIALFKALMIGLVLSIPLVMASWFSSALVLFHQIPPSKAMLMSLSACNRNMFAFLLYGLLLTPLLMLAMLPLALGLLIMIPVIFIGQYCSYKVIFSQQQSDKGVFIV
ncbi:MAG: hypothetical protein DRQ47_01420 [Gammaproteobacteria bacterium]|nr:MAG: hypothetical protein DRQ47_01420 [Gammaproteobacteria bacterium]